MLYLLLKYFFQISIFFLLAFIMKNIFETLLSKNLLLVLVLVKKFFSLVLFNKSAINSKI